MGTHDPKKAPFYTEALNIHFALGSRGQVNEIIEDVVPVVAERAVLQATQPLDACRFITGEKKTVPHPSNCRKILVERILHMAQRSPIGKGERDLV
jgi:hypothetical protein